MLVTLSQFLQLAFVGLVSGLFSSMLAHRAHQQKQWWDLRVSAYQELLYALSDLCYYYREHYEAYTERNDMPDELNSKLSAIWNEGNPKVRRAADVGAFLFSTEVANALSSFRKTNDARYDSSFEHLDANFAEAEKCLKAVVDASKKDLKLNWWSR